MKKHNRPLIIIFLVLFVWILAVNYIIGTGHINHAASVNWNGGMSTAETEKIAGLKLYGFDIYWLMYSAIPFALIGSFVSAYHLKTKILDSLGTGILYVILWTIGIELIVRMLQVPVLYTHFMEGRKSLHYEFITLFPGFISIFMSIEAVFFSFVGSLLGKFIVISAKKMKK